MILSRQALIVFVLAVFFIGAGSGHASASTQNQLSPAPDLESQAANCFRSIIDLDDLYCSVRYDLPVQSDPDVTPVSAEEWCAELFDTSGCTDDPVVPDAPESLEQGKAFVTFYDNCTAGGDCSSADVIDTGRIPRVGTSLAGVYVGTGHSITFGDTDIYGCVESSAFLFSTQTRSCQRVVWSTVSNTILDMREDLGNHFVDQMLQLEIIQAKGVNFYVENNLITSEGKQIVLEALNVADRILDVFRTSAQSVITSDFATATAQSNLQATISASTPVVIGSTVNDLFGGGNRTGGLIATLIGAFAAFIGTYMLQQRVNSNVRGADQMQLPLAALFTVGIGMMYANEIDFNVIAIVGVIFASVSGPLLYRKLFGS